MDLSQQQEEQLLNHYDNLLWKIVHQFKKTAYTKNNAEDLHSECVLVFIQHIRSCSTMEGIKKIPFRDMRNAMCRFVISEQALTYPKRTTDFGKVTHRVPEKIDWAAVEYAVPSPFRQNPLNTVMERVAFESFINALPPKDRRYVQMKLAGMSNTEIAKALGVNNVMVTRTLQRLCKAYQEESS